MMRFDWLNCWRAEALRLSRQPVAWLALGALAAVLLAAAVSAGMDARAWRQDAGGDAATRAARIEEAQAQLAQGPGPAAAVAAYQLGRGELGGTRMSVAAGLGLGVQRLEVLPVRLKASMDSRQLDARDPGPLRNPLLAQTGLPGVPAMVALLLPLAALVLCAGLVQEEREQGRLGLLRLQSSAGVWPLVVAALGWRWLALCLVAALATAPALALDPGASMAAALPWWGALGAFSAVWVALGGLLSWAHVSGAASMLAALGLWLGLTFVAPAVVVLGAEAHAPMPSRLAALVEIREVQQAVDDDEVALVQAWYASHPQVPAQLPAVWPASFVPKALEQERMLAPAMAQFADSRARQAAFVRRWAWVSPGLALVLYGESLAATDADSHARYLRQVDAFEARWRDYLAPYVMSRRGLTPEGLAALPAFAADARQP